MEGVYPLRMSKMGMAPGALHYDYFSERESLQTLLQYFVSERRRNKPFPFIPLKHGCGREFRLGGDPT
jgi:hypothetical protein